MKTKLLFYLLFCCSFISYGQLSCPTLTSPINGDSDVPVDAIITWNGIVGAPGYLISIGTTSGGIDIVNNQNVGNATSFQPPLGLPDDSDIYVTITIFFFNQANIICTTEMFTTEDVTQPPLCATPTFPINESENINVATAISWNYTPTATGYRISIGTTLNGAELVDNVNVVGVLSYKPIADLPFETEIFVTIEPYNESGSVATSCPTYSFNTGIMTTIPNCSSLINPADEALNVELSPVLEWQAVPDATGYRVTIGTTPFNSNVLDNVNFIENRTLVIDFEPNLTFFITIIPYNLAGDAIGCQQQYFSTILGCGPYFDSASNQLVDLKPEITFPDILPFCQNNLPFTIESEDLAEGFRWYKIDQFGNEELIGNERSVSLDESGIYKYEAFNTITQSGSTIECENSKTFLLVASEQPTINDLIVTDQNGIIEVTIQASGIGNYEYAVNDINGPYQNSNVFGNLQAGEYTFYVRDINGCGITEESFEPDLSIEGFPKFFTPNGDGINEFWQYSPPPGGDVTNLDRIDIFNRYGIFLGQIDPLSIGWNGNFNGKQLPASDYWFTAIATNQKIIRGHFTLKR